MLDFVCICKPICDAEKNITVQLMLCQKESLGTHWFQGFLGVCEWIRTPSVASAHPYREESKDIGFVYEIL